MTVAAALGIAGPASGLLRDLAAHWSAPLIAALEARGVVAGDAEGRFHPDDPLTRAQMAKLLVAGLGGEPDARLLARYDSRFADVGASHWARGYIEALAERGITRGYGDGTFGPEDKVTRAQMVVFLVRAAGLDEEARGRRFETTPFRDDAEIPDWARGAVNVALSRNLVTGFEDFTFRPMRPITRAEGGATLLRLMQLTGRAFHLSGTLVAYDPNQRRAVVRDAMGQERAVTMALDAIYFRGGAPATHRQIQPLDQVWIVLDERAQGIFMDARTTDLFGRDAVVAAGTIALTMPAGNRRTFTVQPGALIFYNGRPAELAAVDGASEVYIAVDRITKEVRVLDAVHAPHEAVYVGQDPASGQILVNMEAEARALAVDPDAVILLNGERVTVEGLQSGDRLRMALNEDGAVTYLQAER